MALVEDFPAIANRLRELKGGVACDCGQAIGHSHYCAIFRCSVCGVLCDSAPNDRPTVCPDHCPDHDYRYERGEGHRCIICSAPPPDDWFDAG